MNLAEVAWVTVQLLFGAILRGVAQQTLGSRCGSEANC
jgi:hypothetical protein